MLSQNTRTFEKLIENPLDVGGCYAFCKRLNRYSPYAPSELALLAPA